MPEVVQLEFGSGGEKEQNQSQNSQHRDKQFECCRSLDSVNIKGCEKKIEGYCDCQDGNGWEKQIKIGTDGQGYGRRGKDEFNILGHPRKETPIFAERFHPVVKGTPCFRNRTCHFCITECEGQVHDYNEDRGNRQPKCTPLF